MRLEREQEAVLASPIRRLDLVCWVTVKELKLSYYIGETLLFTIYTHYGNLSVLRSYWGYMGIMEKKMETMIMGYMGYRIYGVYGCSFLGLCSIRLARPLPDAGTLGNQSNSQREEVAVILASPHQYTQPPPN